METKHYILILIAALIIIGVVGYGLFAQEQNMQNNTVNTTNNTTNNTNVTNNTTQNLNSQRSEENDQVSGESSQSEEDEPLVWSEYQNRYATQSELDAESQRANEEFWQYEPWKNTPNYPESEE